MTFFKNFKYNYFIIIRVYYRNDKFKEVLRMKRIKAACICQTLHFQLKEDVAHDYAVQLVHEEFNHYKKSLEKRQTKYKIIATEDQPDGSIIVKIIKQYNTSPVGDYLD
mgnify:FL=1